MMPALSLQIQALEEEIGGKLFERDRRKTVLTAAGVAFSKGIRVRGANDYADLAHREEC